MNKYLKKAFIISASALLFLSVGAGVNNVQARRYHYRYHRRVNRNKYGYWKHYRKHGRTRSYFVRYKTGYFHNGRWVRYKSNKPRRVRRTRSYYRTQARRRRARALAAKRRRDAFTRHHIDIILNAAKPKPRRVHHYHILVDGVDDGWTTNYRTYKNSVNEIKADIQKDEQQMQAQQEASDQQSQEGTDQSSQAQPTDDSSQQTQTTDQTQSSQPADTDTDDDAQAGNGVGTGTTPALTRFAQQVQTDTVNDINRDREADGLQPYTESQALDEVAQIRANQIPFGHFNDQGQVENGVIAQQLGQDPAGGFYAENLGGNLIGKVEPSEEAHTTNTSTPARAADSDEYSFLNYDADSNYGHRKSILNPDYSSVGVGVHGYTNDSNQKEYSLVEEFE